MESVYNGFYRRHQVSDRCFYCGDPATELDHTPALSVVQEYSVRTLRQMRVPLRVVSSCRWCNGRLRNQALLTSADRLEFLIGRLEGCLDKEKAIWTPEEIAEMGRSLRDMAAAKARKREESRIRLEFMKNMLDAWTEHPVFDDFDEESLASELAAELRKAAIQPRMAART